MMSRPWFLVVLVTSGVLAALILGACQNLPTTIVPTVQSTGPTEVTKPPPGGEPTQLNLDEIFPPGEGRDLVLQNCGNCHGIGPIVVLQMSRGEWERNARTHKDRLGGLSDQEFTTVYEYVIANFNPDRPIPEVPQPLLMDWPAYQ